MIRIVVENIFFFMLPTFAYIAWVAFKEDEWAGIATVLRRAPLLRLFVAGAVLMLATLVTFSSRSHNNPQDVYIPPSIQDGKVAPGRSVHEPPPTSQDP